MAGVVQNMTLDIRVVAALLFGSGLTSLVYQTAWQRMFRVVFGASTLASAAVLGIFLGGLGLGGLWFGRRIEKSERPLVYYGNLELGVAVLAALTPWLMEAGSWVYFALGATPALGTAGATAVRLLIAALVMGPVAVLMGGTLPAAARAVESDSDAARGKLAVLYAVNTLGAVAGSLIGTFLTFEVLGTRLSLWTAVLLNLLVAVVARALGRDAPKVPASEASAAQTASREPSGAVEEPLSVAPRALVYAVAAVAGFVFSSQELVWYRMLAPLLGGSSFTFGLLLAIALFGIGAGGYLYSRRPEGRPASLELLTGTLVLTALAIALPFALGDTLALYAAYTRPLSALGFPALVATWLAVGTVVILPAALVAGYQFPVIFALLGRGRHEVARQVGVAYAFNTVGAIAGAWIGGFWLLPVHGAVATWRLSVFALLAMAAVALAQRLGKLPGELLRVRGAVAALGVLAAACALATGPSAVWRHAAIGAGRFEVSGDRNGLLAQVRQARRHISWEQDGVESSVAMATTDGIGFLVNGKSDGSVRRDRGTQGMLGLAPALLHAAPKNVFVLGLGTGMTAGWVASVPGVERVDVAELEPAVIEVARAAALANQDVLGRKNVHVIEGDGRELLRASAQRYDVIVSEPSNPYRAGVASLFTQEFYRVVDQRLAPGGIFAQWVQGYEVDMLTLRTVLKTLYSVFSEVEIWHTQSDDLMLLATREPSVYDLAHLRERLAAEPYRSALPRLWLVEGAEGFFSHFLAPAALSRNIADAFDPAINTDDSTVLEYAFARQVGVESEGVSLQLLQLAHGLGRPKPQLTGTLDWARVRELEGRSWWMSGATTPPLPGALDQRVQMRLDAVELGCSSRPGEVLGRWNGAPGSDAPPHEPRDVVETFVLGNAHALAGHEQALALADVLLARGFPTEAQLIRGRFQLAKQRLREGVTELIVGLTHLRQDALTLCLSSSELITSLSRAARAERELRAEAYRALMAGPFAAYTNEDLRLQTAQELAADLDDPGLCLAALGQDLQLPRWDLVALERRARCLGRAKHPLFGEAEADMEQFLVNTPGRIAAGLNLDPKLPLSLATAP